VRGRVTGRPHLDETTDDPEQIRAIVERVILADRATKEEVPS
jgi:hypothetical protein